MARQTRRPTGRPKLPPGTARTRMTFTVLREAERAELDRVAEETGRSRSSLVREALLTYLASASPQSAERGRT